MILLDNNSTDFLGIRHGWTLLDLHVQRNAHEKYVVVPEKGKLKGWSDELHRESDAAVLAAEATAYAIVNAYEQPLKSGERKLISMASESGRTSEHQQVIWYILSQEIGGNFEHKTSPNFRERFFANIQGLNLDEIEKKVINTRDDSGILYPNVRQALTYTTDFRWLEKAFGVQEFGGETFEDYVTRAYEGARELAQGIYSQKEKYICLIILHQIGGIPILKSFRWLNRDPEDVRNQIKHAKTQDQKEALFDYFHIDPARLQRIRLCKGPDRIWYELHENNDAQHLALLMEDIKTSIRENGRLEGVHGNRANQIRDSIAPWYVKQGWPVNPYENPGDPFVLKDAHDTPEPRQIRAPTPIDISTMLMEKERIPDSFVGYHFGNYINISHIPDWMEHSFGYRDLASRMMLLNRELANSDVSVCTIRERVSKTIRDYVTQQ